MKSRGREINIFSMSALDLFASGMGAFILLAVMALPFFPNTGSSPENIDRIRKDLAEAKSEAEQSKDELEKAKKELGDANKKNEELSDELVKVRIPDLDIVICLDITNSMEKQISGLKSEITDLATVFSRLAPSVGIGVVAFGDRVFAQPIHKQDIVEMSDMTELNAFVNSLKKEMGNTGGNTNPDSPEALDLALATAISMNWRAKSELKYIVIITDALPYPEKEYAAIQRATEFSSQPNRAISTVMVGGNDAESFLRKLASAGGGEFVNGKSGQSMTASLMLAVLKI